MYLRCGCPVVSKIFSLIKSVACTHTSHMFPADPVRYIFIDAFIKVTKGSN